MCCCVRVTLDSAGAVDVMSSPNTPGCVYLLADHLDMLLAAGEDLQNLEFENVSSDCSSEENPTSIQKFVRQVRELENAAIGRLMRARAQAAQLGGDDERFAMLARLFLSGTAHVSDALQQFKNPETAAFDCGGDPIDYATSRGLVADETGCLSINAKLSIGEQFRLGGHIEMGPLLDLCAQLLDSLDTQFGLFPEIPPAAEMEPKAPEGRTVYF